MNILYENVARHTVRIIASRIRPFWKHPAGPKTIFFWAPIGKWSLVVAGIGDLMHSPRFVSTQQSTALAMSGIIWCRYSTVIRPKNWNLLIVNAFVALTGIIHLIRAYKWNEYEKKDEWHSLNPTVYT